MPKDPKLTKEIKEKLSVLEPQLKRCIKTANLKKARIIIQDIQLILKPKNYNSRLMQNKNYYYEVLLESGQVQTAIVGLIGVTKKVSATSRMYLEAISLLSICYIRLEKLHEAQIYIDKTISKINNIKSDKKRHVFHSSYLDRTDDEILLYSIKSSAEANIDINKVHSKSIELIRTKNEIDLYKILGNCISDESIKLVTEFQKNNLLLIPTKDRLYLPAPLSNDRKEAVGRKFGSAIKRVVWKALCDPDNDIYKMWSQGLSIVHDKKYITAAIVATFANWKIGTVMMAASVAALAIRFGIGIFCEIFEPESIMEKR